MGAAPERLYVVVRSDIPSGLQMAQAIHAAFAFASEHQAAWERWRTRSNVLAVLTVPDEAALGELLLAADRTEVGWSAFAEPDLGDTITAIALGPGDGAARVCRGLPLACPAPVA